MDRTARGGFMLCRITVLEWISTPCLGLDYSTVTSAGNHTVGTVEENSFARLLTSDQRLAVC